MRNGCSSPSTPTLDDSRPVFPFLGHFGQNVAHHHGRGHEAVTFALENTDFASAHRLAEPSHIVDGYARVLGAVVDDYFAVNVYVSEADCLAAFEADQEIDSGIGVGGC